MHRSTTALIANQFTARMFLGLAFALMLPACGRAKSLSEKVMSEINAEFYAEPADAPAQLEGD